MRTKSVSLLAASLNGLNDGLLRRTGIIFFG